MLNNVLREYINMVIVLRVSARLKGLQTAYRFELENHPNADSNRGWLVLGTQTLIQDISGERADNQFYDSQVKFLVQPDEQILRPVAPCLSHMDDHKPQQLWGLLVKKSIRISMVG